MSSRTTRRMMNYFDKLAYEREDRSWLSWSRPKLTHTSNEAKSVAAQVGTYCDKWERDVLAEYKHKHHLDAEGAAAVEAALAKPDMPEEIRDLLVIDRRRYYLEKAWAAPVLLLSVVAPDDFDWFRDID